ncbi:MAG: hypothetical protein Q9187_004958 [Circinaria calcarea]
MAQSEQETDSWLISKPPWDSTASSPFVPHGTSKALISHAGGNGYKPIPSNFALLSKLCRTCVLAGLDDIQFPTEDRYGISLGEGTTYKVEKKRLWASYGQKRTWVAAKRAKFVAPKGLEGDIYLNKTEYTRLRAVLLEVEILSHPPVRQHPNITQILGFSWDQEASGYAPVLVMELAAFGSVKSLLENEVLSDAEKKALCADIASGLEVLHACMIVHGDVKQENVLVFPHPDQRFVAKLSDFELALLDSDVGCYKGTPIYNAPEVHLQQRCQVQALETSYTIPPAQLPLCDVFSFGLLAFEILSNGRRYYEFSESKAFQQELTSENSGRQFSNENSDDVLAFCYEILALRKEILGEQMWAELRYFAENGATPEQCGRAHFDLFILYTLGRSAPSLGLHEAMNWMAASALFGYAPALMIGKRVFQANNLPIPSVFSDGSSHKSLHAQIAYLETLPAVEFYSNAVRIFWTEEMCGTILNLLPPGKPSFSPDDLETWIRKSWNEMGHRKFSAFAEEGFLLHHAVSLRHYEATKLLIDYGCRVDILTPNHLTPLHLACRCGCISLIHLLLSYGADASLNDTDNISPLHWLVLLSGHEIPAVAFALVKNGANIDSRMNDKRHLFFDALGLMLLATPLFWACTCRNHVAVTTLLSLGANPDGLAQSSRGEGQKQHECTLIAAGTVCADILELLLEHTDVPRTYSAADKEELYGIIGGGISNNLLRWCMHGSAYEEAFSKVIDTLIRYEISLPRHPLATLSNQATYTPLARAAISFNIPLVKALLQQGANTNDRSYYNGATALSLALDACVAEVASPAQMIQTIELLVRNGASLEPESHAPRHRLARQSPLFLACISFAPPEVVHLLASNAPSQINVKQHWATPIYTMASTSYTSDDERAIRILLDLGADPDIETDHKGPGFECCLTATAGAVINDSWVTTELLLDRHASTEIGIAGGHRQTLAHLSVYRAYILQARGRPGEDKGVISRLKSLLDHPVAQKRDLLNDADYKGLTPLAYAIMFGLPHIVRVFLDRGASAEPPPKAKPLLQLVKVLYREPPKFVTNCDADAEPEPHMIESVRLPPRSLSEYKKSLDEIRSLLAISLSVGPN